MYFIHVEVCEKISIALNLPYTGIEQDWDIEMADKDRINEFIEFATTKELNENEKHAVIALLIASYDDFLDYGLHDVEIWRKIKSIILNNRKLCDGLLKYWSCKYSNYISTRYDVEFNITPLMQELL